MHHRRTTAFEKSEVPNPQPLLVSGLAVWYISIFTSLTHIAGGLMAALSSNIKKLLARTKLVVLPEDFFVVELPVDIKPIPGEWYRPATTRFAVFIREPKQITLIVNRRKWLRMQNIFEKYIVRGPVKVLAFDVKLSQVARGYMATIGTVLAEARLGCVPVSSFLQDHIIVPKADLPRTVRVIRQFLESCRDEPASGKERASRGRKK